ncbi:ribonucleases P/MRP protein subunit POP1 [Salvia miltiorrhiza]|uniref:ribonucleases P/MRP protein subunit POP1 n=1 Tax=Salvia miltiorrhiza TaxID=226208 RepID=UPI0025AD2F41|nr:ribonucleases P/MRP protein subunit POP1 [Salvia miltiorrhiza]XP_057783640.1 ribonucleases P/MRP protein subunit POP1 [Salvia miltiorrhiza]XP_057783641.1 ribonucleases P/MRP protein subunit POP1 [Salvia miltiorrhiza]
MVTNSNKAGVPAPPHELHVWKFAESRAPEIEGLHSIIADRLDNNFQSQRNKRRRTTGHDDRVARKKFRKRSNGLGHAAKIDSMRKDENKVSRRVRRNVELKKNLPTGYGTSGDGTKRLRTHVWHAKRFKMEKLWGFYIPLGLHGRGRGSRALLKKLKNGVLVHDASYYSAIQLEGPQETLISVLRSVLVPSPSACCEETLHDVLVGNVFGTAMLHDSRNPSFPPVAPVTYMWRPMQQISTNVEELSREVSGEEQNIDNTAFIHQLWLWIHAASFKEAYDSLSSACEKNTEGTCSAHCVSREGQLAKLELIGPKVFQLLHKTLQPAKLNSENSWHVKKCSAHEHEDTVEYENASIFENGHQISSSAVLSLVVKDPRNLTKKGGVVVSDGKNLGMLGNEDQSKEQHVSSIPKHKADFEKKCGDLWDAIKVVDPPVEESVLCADKHHLRKEFFCLGQKGSGSQNATIDQIYTRSCPVLLLKNENFEDSVTRCSLILPLSWVKAFWITFVSNGAHAIGLREKHWVACEIGLPYFPLDFPDCNAYSDFMEMEAATVNHKAMLVPPSKRQPKVPIPPPWDCVLYNSGKKVSKAGNIEADALGTQDEKSDDMEKNFASEKSHDRISDCQGTPFEGVVARTSSMLNDFLNNISGNRLLFPSIPGQENCLHKFMRNKDFLKQDIALSEMKLGKTPCFVRVLLRAFKEGVFEQGAVVCAPLATDIRLWTASSENNDEQLQITQSSVMSYFMQSPSGKWELQIPEDQALSSHRLPIGFVTTGFVRGSKKAMAGAICEASLLSRLREEQWKAVPVRRRRKEIYVLVRNMRSTAYRLACATIVLEQQEQDANFM